MKRTSIIVSALFFLAASAAATSGTRAQEPSQLPNAQEVRPPALAPAQRPPATPRIAPEKLQRIYHIRQLEGLLTNAVKVGANSLAARLRAEPNSLFVTSNARTRGFELEEYGVFFAVDVPTIMPSVLWSTQVLQRRMQDVVTLRDALADPKTTPGMRSLAEMDLRRLERTLGLQSSVPSSPNQQAAPQGVAVAATAENMPLVEAIPDTRDPNEIYTDAIKDKLIDAMLVYGGALRLDDSEWLTVAARSASDNLSGLDDSSSIVLRLKGADLNAYIMKKLTRDEVVKKIEIKEG